MRPRQEVVELVVADGVGQITPLFVEMEQGDGVGVGVGVRRGGGVGKGDGDGDGDGLGDGEEALDDVVTVPGVGVVVTYGVDDGVAPVHDWQGLGGVAEKYCGLGRELTKGTMR